MREEHQSSSDSGCYILHCDPLLCTLLVVVLYVVPLIHGSVIQCWPEVIVFAILESAVLAKLLMPKQLVILEINLRIQ